MEAIISQKDGKEKKRQTQTASKRSTKKTRPKLKQAIDSGQSDQDVEKFVTRIRELKLQETESRAAMIQCRIEIGNQLQALRERTEHGQWLDILKGLDFGVRQAQRLMTLAKSDLADQMRHGVTHLGCRLPSDMQKLDLLTKLSIEQVVELLDEHDIDEMGRDELARHVRTMLHGPDEGVAESESPPADSNPSVEADADEIAGASWESDGKTAEDGSQELLSVLSANRSIAQPATQAADPRRRIEVYKRLMEGGDSDGPRAVRFAIDGVFDAFVQEVLPLARKWAENAFNGADLSDKKALRREKCDVVILTMVLLDRFKWDFDLEELAFGP